MTRNLSIFVIWVVFLLGTTYAQEKTSANNSAVDSSLGTPFADLHSGTSGLSERYDVSSLQGSELKPKQPLLLEKTTLPEFTRELWQVQWRGDDPIDLYIIKPPNVKKSPVMLFLYGYPADTDRFRDDLYCRTVTKYGFTAVGFVSALTGQRYHDRPWKQWFISELQESLVTSVHDVQMILNHLSMRDDIDMNRVGMFGQGSGGTIALLAAVADPRLRAVDVLDPWGDWRDWFTLSPIIEDSQRSQYLTSEFQARIADLDPLKLLPQLDHRTLRVQETAFDPITPEVAKRRIRTVLPIDAQFVQYDTVENYKRTAAQEGKILTWLHNQLGQGSHID